MGRIDGDDTEIAEDIRIPFYRLISATSLFSGTEPGQAEVKFRQRFEVDPGMEGNLHCRPQCIFEKGLSCIRRL